VQKKRDKLRTLQEADTDLQGLREKMQLFPNCVLGWWTNSQEDFILKATEAQFEVRFLPLGTWPAPGKLRRKSCEKAGLPRLLRTQRTLGRR